MTRTLFQIILLMFMWCAVVSCTQGEQEGDGNTSDTDTDTDTDTDADSDADADSDSDAVCSGDTCVVPVDTDGVPGPALPPCEEPTPWPLPDKSAVVGDGTPGSCSEAALRTAVEAGGHVTFDCGDGAVTILVESELVAGPEAVIDGGEGEITLDGGGLSRILSAANGNTLSVRNLRFINGAAPLSEEADGIGGAVAGNWRSAVEVRNCIFEDNVSGRGGGAVSVWTGSSLTIVGSHFEGNRSFYGGAVYSLLSKLHVVNSTFVNNATLEDGWGDGGAIGTDGASEYPDDELGGDVTICGTSILGNAGRGSGGGAYIWVYPPDRVFVERSLIEANTIGNGGLGGGMRISNGEIVISHTSFLSNVSDNHGGALYLDCAPTCHITNTTFHGNQAETYGGAISCGGGMRINNATFAANSAGGHGGALFGSEDFEVYNSIFVNNSAGNPWNQANNCGATGQGDHVLQWHRDSADAGGDLCVPVVTNADPLLSAEPADNGGPTPTLLPGAGSPVIGGGTDCEADDQRGEPRDGDVCALGAVEVPE